MTNAQVEELLVILAPHNYAVCVEMVGPNDDDHQVVIISKKEKK